VLDLSSLRPRGAVYEATARDGQVVRLTLDPTLQVTAERTLLEAHALHGAAVVLSVEDGKVLAMAATDGPEVDRDASWTLRPWAPAASVFKLVTAAALVNSGKVTPSTEVCYHGGQHRLSPAQIVEPPGHDRECQTLEYGIARSQNALVAKLAYHYLPREALQRTATALGFNRPMEFAAAVEPSTVQLPTDAVERARVAAGFWSSSLSPLQGAVLASVFASGGLYRAPRIVDSEPRPPQGAKAPRVAPPPGAASRRVLPATVADAVGHMMVSTTRYGTARSAFFDRRGRAFLPGIEVAGKTGSLTEVEPYRDYSWFVGFAPADRPRVAFAVVLANPPKWRVKAAYVARVLVEAYVDSRRELDGGVAGAPAPASGAGGPVAKRPPETRTRN
jgi:cell division protein FtsI/penicillin-binding protein 2